MGSTFTKELSAQPEAKWIRSEWFGMPGRAARPSPPDERTAPELDCVLSSPDKLVQNLNFRDTLSGQDTLGGKIRAKRVA